MERARSLGHVALGIGPGDGPAAAELLRALGLDVTDNGPSKMGEPWYTALVDPRTFEGLENLFFVVPTSYETAQVDPQLIWVGFPGLEVEVTVPVPVPTLLAVKVAFTLKLVALVAVPADVVTVMRPVVAPVGTVARIEVSEFTVKLAPTPLNATAVAPERFVPVMVTAAPTAPLVGVKLVIVGGLMTVNTPVLVAVPSAVVTLSGPLVAPAGTVA